MGIPGMYRWLVERYPNTLCSVSEKPSFLGINVDLTEPNPNGVEFDNLYIDINGIIHPCFHPEQGGIPAPKSYDEVLKAIIMYINKVFSIIRPRKLLYLALDGVAPRAKMNQQRIRRFTTAKEAAAKEADAKDSALEVEGDTQMDSNVITPGTEFMELLSSTLKYYVEYKMTKAPEWQDIRVILSDSTVVGEGEYKIMSYIRSQRNLPEYDPNTRHCLHGMDADLIMLALATHEIHISILREVITYGKKTLYRKQKQNPKQKQLYPRLMKQFIHKQKFEFFNIWVLREYLERDLLPNVEGIDFERLIDDFVFFCFFVGNDFLPRLPLLDVSEGGIELLLIIYQEEFVKMGYLTNAPEVNLKSMEHFLQALSAHENAIFYKRSQHIMEKSKSKRKRGGFQDSVKIDKSQTNQGHYIKKFDCKSHDIDRIKRDAVLKYTEGVCWIMHYYYQGLCSWQWFYPYHYAPFASDFCGLDKLEINFTLGQPLKPFDQLLGVLPAASAQALPLFYRELMTKESSPILDFYPNDTKVDRNGKKHAWQGVCKLPFIDESRLLSEAVKVETTLTEKEKQRNRFGKDNLFVHRRHPLSKFIKEHLLCDPSSKLQIQITSKLSGGVTGYVCVSDKLAYTCKKPSGGAVGMFTMNYNNVISVGYKCPSHVHIPKLLCGVIMPPKILRSQDTPCPPVVWHADVSQSIVFESPTEETQKKKRKQDDKSRIHCVDDGNKNGYGKSQVDLDLVEGCEKRLIVEESRDKQIEHILASEAKYLVEGTENINKNIITVNGEKPPNKMEEQDDDDDIINHLVGKTESLIIPCAMECDLVKGQEEINISCQDKSMNGFQVSEKEAKKKKKKKKHVNDEQVADEEKTKKQVKASEKPEIRLENKEVIDEINNNNITREKETENDDDAAAVKSQRKRKRKRQQQQEVPIAIAAA